ncbi:hypothetical protein [Ruminococcus sp.]|uniref:hypothetical protein n=1 Tax=Ruminococcus sp. TaxID=41978 RepID=UPI0025E4C1E0|nr:hypothetical protein [Ruminococcus sp.]
MSLHIPAYDAISTEELVSIIGGACQMNRLISYKHNRVENIYMLSDIDYFYDIDSIVGRDTIKRGILALQFGYNSAKIWCTDNTIPFDEIHDSLASAFHELYKSQSSNLLISISNNTNIAVKLYPSNAEAIAHLSYDYLSNYISSIDTYVNNWDQEYTQVNNYIDALYIIGISYYINENDIDVENKIQSFLIRTHYKFAEKLFSYTMDNVVPSEICSAYKSPRLQYNFEIFELKKEILTKELIGLKNRDILSGYGVSFPRDFIRLSFYLGLVAQLYDSYNSNPDTINSMFTSNDSIPEIISSIESAVSKNINNLSPTKVIELSYQCTAAILEFQLDGNSQIDLNILDVLDCSMANFMLGIVIGAYAYNHYDYDTRY